MTDREKVVAQAKAWVGAKQGDATYAEIMRIFETNGQYKYDGQGCCEFVCACYIKALGLAKARKYIPIINYANAQAKLWNKLDDTPRVGSLVYFDYKDGNGISHVEIVVEVTALSIKTIDGNSYHKVINRTRGKGYKYIAGYGTPLWDEEKINMKEFLTAVADTLEIRKGAQGEVVLFIQKYLKKNGFYKDGLLDGKFGSYMFTETKKWQKSVGLASDGWYGKNALRYILREYI